MENANDAGGAQDTMNMEQPIEPVAVELGKEKRKVWPIVVLAGVAAAGLGFGIYGMVAKATNAGKVADLTSQLEEKDKTIAELRGESGGNEGDDEDRPIENEPQQPLAKKLLIDRPEQDITTVVGGGFVLDIETSASNFIFMHLTKNVGGLTEFDKEQGANSQVRSAVIGGSIDLRNVGSMFGVEGSDSEQFEVSGIDADRVVDIFVCGFGQAVGDETAFFLMDDGTVEYMRFKDAVKNKDYRSQGKLDGVENAIKFMQGAATYGPYGMHDAIVQRADGKFYSLWHVLSEMGKV